MSTALAFLTQPENSKLKEQFAEYLFLQELIKQLAAHSKRVEVYRGDYDAFGSDLLLRCEGVIRYVQLKAVAGKATTWDVHKSLLLNTDGAIVLIRLQEKDGNIDFTIKQFDRSHTVTALARHPKVAHQDKCKVNQGEFLDITDNLGSIFGIV